MNKKVMSAVLAAATVAGLAAGCMTASAEDDKLVVYAFTKLVTRHGSLMKVQQLRKQ